MTINKQFGFIRGQTEDRSICAAEEFVTISEGMFALRLRKQDDEKSVER